MTVYQLLQAYKPMLKTMSDNGYRMHDIRDVEIYEEYQRIISEGNKKTYAYAVLKERYNVGKTSIFYIIKKMEREARM